MERKGAAIILIALTEGKMRESNKPVKRPSLINQSTKPEDRFKFARETEGRSFCNLFFEFLFGR